MRNCKYMTFRLNQEIFLVMAQDFHTRTCETFYIDCEMGVVELYRGAIEIVLLEKQYPFRFRRLHPWFRAWIRSVMEAAPPDRWASSVGMRYIPAHVLARPVVKDLWGAFGDATD